MRYVAFVVMTTVCATAWAAKKSRIEKALELPVSHFKETMQIDDVPEETLATFSTVDGFQAPYGLIDTVWTDAFLRGTVDRQTGDKRYEVYVVLRHTLGGWQWPYEASYGTPLRTAQANQVHRGVDCSGREVYGTCRYVEHAVFDVDEEELRGFQHDGGSQGASAWPFQLKNKVGKASNDSLLRAEIVALLEMMDAYELTPAE